MIPLCGLLTYNAVDAILTYVQKVRAPIGAVVVTGLGYTLPAVLAVIAVCALEFGVLRTGLFRRPAYWISMVIVFGFQILGRRLADQAVAHRSSSTTTSTPAASGSRSTSPSRTSCSASPW